MMQPMLMGKAHGAVYLVDLLSDDAHRFTNACFAGRHFGDETVSYTHLTLPTMRTV